jgi:ankyrin repeat protein
MVGRSWKEVLRTLLSFNRIFRSPILSGCAVGLLVLISNCPAFCTTIQDAAAAGDVATLRSMLETNPALASAREVDGMTALHVAALYGHKEVVEVLLAFHADVGAEDKNGDTALHLAAAKGRQEVVAPLLRHHADLNAKDVRGATPLHVAVFYKQNEMARLLVASRADVQAADENGDTPLHMAAETGSVELSKLLLANHADVNARDISGFTPLYVAAFFKHEDVATVLRQHGGQN